MRQISTILIILFSTLISLGQDTTRIKTVKKYQGKKIRFIGRYDKNGNCYFTKNDGLNGPVIMILGWDFDELNRDIRSIFAHSNVGFSVSEKKYESNLIKTFGYTIDTINEYKIVNDDSSAAVNLNEFKFNPYDIIEKINSKEELENIEDIIKLFKGKKFRNWRFCVTSETFVVYGNLVLRNYIRADWRQLLVAAFQDQKQAFS
jgi:hypothetical protein